MSFVKHCCCSEKCSGVLITREDAIKKYSVNIPENDNSVAFCDTCHGTVFTLEWDIAPPLNAVRYKYLNTSEGYPSVIVRKVGQGIYPITNIFVQASLFTSFKGYTDEFLSENLTCEDYKLNSSLFGRTEEQKPCNNDNFMKFEFKKLKIVYTSYQLCCKFKLCLALGISLQQENPVDRMLLGYVESAPIHVYSNKILLPEEHKNLLPEKLCENSRSLKFRRTK